MTGIWDLIFGKKEKPVYTPVQYTPLASTEPPPFPRVATEEDLEKAFQCLEVDDSGQVATFQNDAVMVHLRIVRTGHMEMSVRILIACDNPESFRFSRVSVHTERTFGNELILDQVLYVQSDEVGNHKPLLCNDKTQITDYIPRIGPEMFRWHIF